MSWNLQALRAIAAYGVVGHHVIDSLRHHIAVGRFTFNPALGSTGVHVFFVISGYLMVSTVQGRAVTPWDFARRRIRRVVPLYWLLTAITGLGVAAGFELFGNRGLDRAQLLSSFLFVPRPGMVGREALPVLFVGWTLQYEMAFYALFAACLFIRSDRRRLFALVGVIGLAWLAQVLTAGAWLDWLGRDLVLAFALGALLVPIAGRCMPSPVLAGAIAVAGVAGLATIDLPAAGRLPGAEVVLAVSAAAVVYAALALERAGISSGRGFLAAEGDASYSLYLVHPFVLQAVGKASIVSGINRSVPGLVATVVVMVATCALAARFVHRHIEAPLTAKKVPLSTLFSGWTRHPIVREI